MTAEKNQQEISLIAAYACNNVIGKDGRIPWYIPGEQKRFKTLTSGNVVVMGRKTFEEIFDKLKKPLPDRINLVVSSTKDFAEIGCPTFLSLEEALKFAALKFPEKKVFICGGSRLYEQAVPIVKKMYITEIELKIDGDVFFPLFNKEKFDIITEGVFNDSIKYKYLTYIKKE